MSVTKDFKPADTWADAKQHDHYTGLMVIGLIAFAILAGVFVNLRETFTFGDKPAVQAMPAVASDQMYNGLLAPSDAALSAAQPLAQTPPPQNPNSNDSVDESPMAFFSFYDELPNRQVTISEAPAQTLRTAQNNKPRLLPTTAVAKQELNEIMLPPPPVQTQPVTKPVTPEPAANGRGYIIQAGAFNKFTQADKVRGRLASLGFRAYVEAGRIGNVPVHRVRIGPIASASQAKAIRSQLDNKGIPSITIGPD